MKNQPKTTKKKVTAIFIAYNAARTLEEFYQSFPKDLVDDIILVDDASQDKTFELAKSLGIKSYKNPVNLGYGGNIKRALDLALEQGAEIIIDLHPDGEYESSVIPLALKQIQQGTHLVLGNRYAKGSNPHQKGMYIWKYIPLIILNAIPKMIIKSKIRDFHQGFRVYTRELLENINFRTNSNGFLFSFEVIAQADFHQLKIAEVPVETKYTGKKRGSTLKNSILYTLGVFKVIGIGLVAKAGIHTTLFYNQEKLPEKKNEMTT
jgi:glycosyltransferase involved in cell wall biosynthesis